MDNKPKGGRGLRAPYETRTVRVPVDILPLVEKLAADFRETGAVPSIGSDTMASTEAIEKARTIYKSKLGRTKSASQSMEKLLQVIYNDGGIQLL